VEDILIKVSICDRHYPLRIEVGLEEDMREGAKLVNDKAKDHTKKYSVKDQQDALAIDSLDLATDHIAANKQNNSISTQAYELLAQINQTLDNKLN